MAHGVTFNPQTTSTRSLIGLKVEKKNNFSTESARDVEYTALCLSLFDSDGNGAKQLSKLNYLHLQYFLPV